MRGIIILALNQLIVCNHSWECAFLIGSFCYVRDLGKFVFPQGVASISDVITLTADLGNKIPDKSWMLYLLEIFNLQNIAVELNLICSFNDNGKFHAIFNGVNQYEFKEITPILGHSFLRQIILKFTQVKRDACGVHEALNDLRYPLTTGSKVL